jgi:hypothetical protein
MKLLRVRVFACVVGVALSVIGCGGDPSDESPPAEKTQSALSGVIYQTVPGHNKAEASDIYSCLGWSFRLLVNWEQHTDPASSTGWYANLGASSAGAVGTVNDVSADVYLQCYWGILPADHGTVPGGGSWTNRLLALSQGIPCSITTVWPASWHLPNPTQSVTLNTYDYIPMGANGNGEIWLGLSSATSPTPGSGWCGDDWKRFAVTTTDKFNGSIPPPPQLPYCPAGYGWNVTSRECDLLPPCWGLSIPDYQACVTPPPPPL